MKMKALPIATKSFIKLRRLLLLKMWKGRKHQTGMPQIPYKGRGFEKAFIESCRTQVIAA